MQTLFNYARGSTRSTSARPIQIFADAYLAEVSSNLPSSYWFISPILVAFNERKRDGTGRDISYVYIFSGSLGSLLSHTQVARAFLFEYITLSNEG